MPAQKPAKHARDHLPGGEDPIPSGLVEHIKLFADDEAVVAGDGCFFYHCNRDYDGLVLGDIEIDVSTVSSSGIVQVQVHNVTGAVDMLSTRIQIDANEEHSRTASTTVVIDTANDDVAHGDELRFDVDAAGTGTKGLAVTLKFYTASGLQSLVGPPGATGATGGTGDTGPQGPQGDPGGITAWEGAWLTSTSYQTSDAVSHNGGSYAARQDHTSGASSEPGVGASWETYWMLLAAPGTANVNYETRSTNTILGVADKGKTIDLSASFTQTFEADETLGDGWWVMLRNTATPGVNVTLDPAGSETIDGASTVILYPGEARIIICNGSGGNFNSFRLEQPGDGWRDDRLSTWTYASATTFTVTGEMTAKFSKGARLKLTQTTVKYFLVVASSHTAGTTTVTVTGGTDYSLANAAISENFFSYEASPQGFPTWFNFSPSYTGFSADPALGGGVIRFMVIGSSCCYDHTPASGGTSNATGFTLTLPITAAQASTGAPCRALNNGAFTTTPGRLEVSAGSATVTVNRDFASATWTNTGGKNAQFIMWYEI